MTDNMTAKNNHAWRVNSMSGHIWQYCFKRNWHVANNNPAVQYNKLNLVYMLVLRRGRRR